MLAIRKMTTKNDLDSQINSQLAQGQGQGDEKLIKP
jgi:hypothetical protein